MREKEEVSDQERAKTKKTSPTTRHCFRDPKNSSRAFAFLPPQSALSGPLTALVGVAGLGVTGMGNRIFGEERASRCRFFSSEGRKKGLSLFLLLNQPLHLSLTSVAVEQRRVGAVQHRAARGDNEHGHARPVFGGDTDLRALEFGRRVKVALEGGLAEERRGFRGVQVHAESGFEI